MHHCVTVPGTCAGWCDLIARHGTMPMRDILAPAIQLAEEGFPSSPLAARGWQAGAERTIENRVGMDKNSRLADARRVRERFSRIPDSRVLFASLRRAARTRIYRGDIAHAIVDAMQKSGGVMTMDDLAAHESTWDTPISTTYRGVRVWECPPNGQGLAALIALNILEEFDLHDAALADPLGTARLHLMIEAMRLAFADTNWYVADPRCSPAPLERLLSKKYAAERRALIDPKKATANLKHGTPVASANTVYLCVVDGAGNGCSFINSNYASFGSGIVPKGYGFVLQNRGHGFVLDPNHPNALAPRKRPFHTIMPGMITREADGSLYAPFGVKGTFMQPQGHVQVVVGMIDDGLDPQAALDRPRFRVNEATPHSEVKMEQGIPFETLSALAQVGHTIVPITGYSRSELGTGQIIRRDHDGVLWGGSEPRADGCAIGY